MKNILAFRGELWKGRNVFGGGGRRVLIEGPETRSMFLRVSKKDRLSKDVHLSMAEYFLNAGQFRSLVV